MSGALKLGLHQLSNGTPTCLWPHLEQAERVVV